MKPNASTAARTSSTRQEDQDRAAEALAAAGEFFDPEARRDEEPQEEAASGQVSSRLRHIEACRRSASAVRPGLMSLPRLFRQASPSMPTS
jgi:hypothetical protein